MSKILSSADITLLDFSVLLDLSLATPTAYVTNMSTVVNQGNLQWVFELTSPSGTPIYVGDFTAPDIDGAAFTTFTIPVPIQQLFGQVEFSNSESYKVKVSVKDANGDINALTKSGSLCKPNGNNGKNNFGAALIDVQIRCGEGRLLITDKTNLTYKSLTGTKVSTTVQVSYPTDNNGNTLSPVTVSSLPAIAPIKYEGDGHEVYAAHVYDYDLGDYFKVRIRYTFTKIFPVYCNVSLEPLFCEVVRIADALGSCSPDSTQNREKHNTLNLANTKLLQAVVGILQPLSGFNVPAIVDDVKDILQIECDCCRPAGISSVGSALATDAIFTANVSCGDLTAAFSNDGNGNIVLNLAGKTYTFIMSAASGNSAAFDFGSSTTGCNKQISLFVDLPTLAEEMLTTLQDNPNLLAILNDITQRATLTCTLDGQDVMDLDSCDYIVDITGSIIGAIMVNVVINGTTYAAPGGTLVTNTSAIQTWLNSLALGTFVVQTHLLGTRITSTANTNAIATVTTSRTIAGSPVSTTWQFINNCGLICTILQKTIDYLQDLNMLQITTGLGLTICRFNTDGTVLSRTFLDTDKLSLVAEYLATSVCNITNYIKDKLVTCDNIKSLFSSFTNTTGNPNGADIVPMFKNGLCQQVPLKNLALGIFQMLSTDVDVKSMYCLGGKCNTVSNCSPVSSLAGTIGDTGGTYTWSAVAGATGYKWSLDGINYTTVLSTSALLTGLTAATSYTIRVYPVYNSGDGISCEITSTFTTTNAGSTCAAPGSLVLDNVTDTSFRATWAAVAGASGYQYQLNGGGWINIGAVLTVSPSGLTPATTYNFNVRAIIGGVPCAANVASSSATTTSTSSENLHIYNGAGFLVVSAIGGLPYVDSTGTMPLSTSESLDGIHGAFTGVLTITTPTGTFPAAYVTLTINGSFVECIDIPLNSPSTYSFASHVFLITDDVTILLSSGTCGV